MADTPAAAQIPAGLDLLRQEVPERLIGKLPKINCGDCKKKNCTRHAPSKCTVCAGWLGYHIHLDYVGHAETTAQLLEADFAWNWEPVAFTPEGLPAFDADGGLWIKLTVCGVTRLGYGTADNASGFKSRGDIRKEIIGDALRNAAMRFGWALNLWAKTDIHERTTQDEPDAVPPPPAPKHPTRAARTHPKAAAADEWSTAGPPAPAPTAPQGEPKMIEINQLTRIAILFKERLGLSEHNDRIAWITTRIAHNIDSTKHLTYAEAEHVIRQLEQEGKPKGESWSHRGLAQRGAPLDPTEGQAVLFDHMRTVIEGADLPAMERLYSAAIEARDNGDITLAQFQALDALGAARGKQLAKASAP